MRRKNWMQQLLGGISALPADPRLGLVCLAEGDAGGAGGGDAGGDKGGGDKGGGDAGGKGGAAAIAAAAGGEGAGSDKGGGGALEAKRFGEFDSALLPENLRGETAEETLMKIYPAFKGMRDKMATQGAVPESADKYPVPELSDEAKKFFPELEKDEVFAIARNAAHKHGMTDKQFQPVFTDILEELGKSGLLQPIVDPTEEAKKLGGDALKLSQAAVDFAERQRTKLKSGDKTGMPEDMIEEFDMMTGTAAGLKLANWFMGQIGEKGVDLGGEGGEGGALTEAEIREARRDPRYRTDSPKHDPEFRKRIDAAHRALKAA